MLTLIDLLFNLISLIFNILQIPRLLHILKLINILNNNNKSLNIRYLIFKIPRTSCCVVEM